MNNRIPDGAVTVIKDITPGMMVKVKGDPVLHKCLDNDIYGDNYVDVWGLKLAHEPRMEYYNIDSEQGYAEYSSYDYVHVDCVEYALPPIPPDTIAIAAKHGEIKLIEVSE